MNINSFEENISNLKSKNNYRELRDINKNGKNINYYDGQYINLSSNDYLGISENILLWNSFIKSKVLNNKKFYGGNSSSRLLTGNSEHYLKLENYLAKSYNSEAALVFNSG